MRPGKTPFVAAYRTNQQQIAVLPSQRNVGFLCDYFKVLPSDPRLWAMTDEQVSDLYWQLEHLHPANEAETLKDPEYEAEEAKLAEENRGVLWPETVVTPAEPEWEPIDVRGWKPGT